MLLFLSYGEGDEESARLVADSLARAGFEISPRRAQRGSEFIEDVENAIAESDAFLVLLSPRFLTSVWCGGERELAMLHEQDLRVGHPGAEFVHVLQIADTPYSESGILKRYAWTDLRDDVDRDEGIGRLAARLRAGSPTAAAASPVGRATSLFRNRDDELALVSGGITNAAGQDFWLVIAPPQLGKTWFLHRLCVQLDAQQAADSPWVMRLLDLREQPPGICGNADAILARLFMQPAELTTNGALASAIARDIGQSGRPYLCLLDNAELLDYEIIRALRASLSEIYRTIRREHSGGGRLAVVIGSRRAYGWTGVAPDPRIATLPLTEFKPHIVKQAVRHLAQQLEPGFDDEDLERDAERVYRLSEGLPALLVRYLQWIRAEDWHGRSRLDSQELFEEIAQPYIQDGLLSFNSLFPSRQDWIGERVDRERAVLENTFRVLSPYRLFTQSHLRHYIETDPDFDRRLRELHWKLEDLWESVRATALLVRPLDEPWQELHAPIRRLLFRYYYRTDSDRANAHREARRFVEVWGHNQTGKEQVMGLVDCLWHEAVYLGIREPASVDRSLTETATKLSARLTVSSAYSTAELRRFAAEKILNDEELQDAVGRVPGLGARLAQIVTAHQ